MSRKIKLHSLHFLFQIFSFLADKTGGWKLFVKPKLIIGSLILGIGITACNTKTKNTNTVSSKKDIFDQSSKSVNSKIKNPEVAKQQTENSQNTFGNSDDSISCYIQLELPEVDKNAIYEVTEVLPSFPGGNAELSKFIYNNLKYPDSAIKNKIQGRVIARFVVNELGVIDRIEVVKSVSPDCDQEAIRVIKMFPKWIPGKQYEENVSVWYTLPINFKLQ